MSWMKGKRYNKKSIAPDKIKELLMSLLTTHDSVRDKPPDLRDIPNSLLENEITVAELNNYIKRKDSAPGVDDFSYSMLFHFPDSAKTFLVSIYNLILNTR